MDVDIDEKQTCVHNRILTSESIRSVVKKSLATDEILHGYEYTFSTYYNLTNKAEGEKCLGMAGRVRDYLECSVSWMHLRMGYYTAALTVPLLTITLEEQDELMEKYTILIGRDKPRITK